MLIAKKSKDGLNEVNISLIFDELIPESFRRKKIQSNSKKKKKPLPRTTKKQMGFYSIPILRSWNERRRSRRRFAAEQLVVAVRG